MNAYYNVVPSPRFSYDNWHMWANLTCTCTWVGGDPVPAPEPPVPAPPRRHLAQRGPHEPRAVDHVLPQMGPGALHLQSRARA